jgi:hypothetical protein
MAEVIRDSGIKAFAQSGPEVGFEEISLKPVSGQLSR